MPRNQDIQICFEEGELVSEYLKAIKNGDQPKEPLNLPIDDDSDVEEVVRKGYVYCDSCKLDVANYCPTCGSLDIDSTVQGFCCSYCDFKFTSHVILSQHKKMCENSDEILEKKIKLPKFVNKQEYVECPFCKKHQMKKYLYHHLKTCGDKHFRSHKKHKVPVHIKFDSRMVYGYTCKDCKMRFDDAKSLQQHTDSHIPILFTYKANTIKPTQSTQATNNTQPTEATKLNFTVESKCMNTTYSPNAKVKSYHLVNGVYRPMQSTTTSVTAVDNKLVYRHVQGCYTPIKAIPISSIGNDKVIKRTVSPIKPNTIDLIENDQLKLKATDSTGAGNKVLTECHEPVKTTSIVLSEPDQLLNRGFKLIKPKIKPDTINFTQDDQLKLKATVSTGAGEVKPVKTTSIVLAELFNQGYKLSKPKPKITPNMINLTVDDQLKLKATVSTGAGEVLNGGHKPVKSTPIVLTEPDQLLNLGYKLIKPKLKDSSGDTANG